MPGLAVLFGKELFVKYLLDCYFKLASNRESRLRTMIAASFHELLKVIEIGAECIALKLDQLFLGFLNDEVSMCNVLMIKNIQEIVTVFLTEEIEDEEEERKEPPKAFSPSKDIAFKPSKVLPALLRIEEKL